MSGMEEAEISYDGEVSKISAEAEEKKTIDKFDKKVNNLLAEGLANSKHMWKPTFMNQQSQS